MELDDVLNEAKTVYHSEVEREISDGSPVLAGIACLKVSKQPLAGLDLSKTKLRELTVEHCENLRQIVLPSTLQRLFITDLPALDKLDLAACAALNTVQISGKNPIKALPKIQNSIKTLYLINAAKVSIEIPSSLENLVLDQCTGLLVSGSPNVDLALSLSGCRGVSVSQNILERVSFLSCDDQAADYSKLALLSYLNVKGKQLFRNVAKSQFPALQKLSADGVDAEDLAHFLVKNKGAKLLSAEIRISKNKTDAELREEMQKLGRSLNSSKPICQQQLEKLQGQVSALSSRSMQSSSSVEVPKFDFLDLLSDLYELKSFKFAATSQVQVNKIAGFESLKELDLRIEFDIVEFQMLNKLKNLEKLTLSKLKEQPNYCQFNINLLKIKQLVIKDSTISLDHLVNMKTLSELTLLKCEGMLNLQLLSTLQNLESFTSKDSDVLVMLPSKATQKCLQSLRIENSNLTNTTIDKFTMFEGLISLSLIGCFNVSCLKFCEQFQNLTSLKILGETKIKTLNNIDKLRNVTHFSLTSELLKAKPQDAQILYQLQQLTDLQLNSKTATKLQLDFGKFPNLLRFSTESYNPDHLTVTIDRKKTRLEQLERKLQDSISQENARKLMPRSAPEPTYSSPKSAFVSEIKKENAQVVVQPKPATPKSMVHTQKSLIGASQNGAKVEPKTISKNDIPPSIEIMEADNQRAGSVVYQGRSPSPQKLDLFQISDLTIKEEQNANHVKAELPKLEDNQENQPGNEINEEALGETGLKAEYNQINEVEKCENLAVKNDQNTIDENDFDASAHLAASEQQLNLETAAQLPIAQMSADAVLTIDEPISDQTAIPPETTTLILKNIICDAAFDFREKFPNIQQIIVINAKGSGNLDFSGLKISLFAIQNSELLVYLNDAQISNLLLIDQSTESILLNNDTNVVRLVSVNAKFAENFDGILVNAETGEIEQVELGDEVKAAMGL